MRRQTLALIGSLAAAVAVLLAALPVLAQQVTYPDAPANQVNGGASSYVGFGATYVVNLIEANGYPSVTIDFSGALPTDGNGAGDLWAPSATLDGGAGTLQGSAGGTLKGCSTTACAYTPPYAGFYGTESFTLAADGTICDDPGQDSGSGAGTCGGGSGIVSGISVTINVYPPPPVDAGGSINTGYGQAATVTLPISGYFTSVWIASGPSHGTAQVSGQQVTYAPAAGFYGSDAFTYQSSGPGGQGNVATISVGVAPPPPPTTAGAAINTAYQTAASVTLPGSGVISSFGLVSGPSHGTVSLSGSSATFTPSAGYYGSDSFVFNATGPGGTSNASTVSITVARPPAPIAQNGALTVAYNTSGSIGLTATGVVSGYALASGASHGAVTLSGATASYTPAANYIGRDSFSFTATGPGGTTTATISVTVNPPPPPVANTTSATCPYQTVCTVTLTTTGITTGLTLLTPATNGTCAISGDTLTYSPAWGAVGADSCTFTASGPGGTSNVATLYVTNEPPALPQPSGSTGAAETPNPDGTATAICAAGQSATFPILPPAPTGTAYDSNWCTEQALTIAQQALQIEGALSAIGNLQSQVSAARRELQGLGSDSTSATLQTINGKLVATLQQATGIGFNALSAGVAFSAAYPSTDVAAGFNGAQLASALSSWQSNTAAALQTSVTVQNQIAQQQRQLTGAVQNAVSASNAAPGATAATQATNQILAAVSTQLAQLQDILIASSQAYDVAQASAQQAAATGAAVGAQTQGQTTTTLSAPTGVTDTSSL